MAPHTFQDEAHSQIAQAFLMVLALIMMIAPFIISKVANIGRPAWPARRTSMRVLPAPRT